MIDKLRFEKCDPEHQGIDSALLAPFRKKMKGEKILGCIILKNDNIVFQYYKNNKVEPEAHHINSCTKSIVSALIGICLKKGIIENINIPIAEYFGDLINAQADERKKEITLWHLLTMTDGLDWPEFGAWHFFSPMRYSNNVVKFILERGMETAPGTRMNYNSGCSHLLAAIIQQAAGMKTADFANEHLFGPLGIPPPRWYEMQGINLGADGLNLKLIDMLKFGYLYLNKGSLSGEEIVPEDWVTQSTAPRFLTYQDIGSYGWHWWCSAARNSEGVEIPYYFAMGYGGQYIIVTPSSGTVAVFVSRDYTDTLLPMRLFREHVLKALLN